MIVDKITNVLNEADKKPLNEGLMKAPIKRIMKYVLEQWVQSDWNNFINQLMNTPTALMSSTMENDILNDLTLMGMDYDKLSDVKPSDYKRASKIIAKYMINILERG